MKFSSDSSGYSFLRECEEKFKKAKTLKQESKKKEERLRKKREEERLRKKREEEERLRKKQEEFVVSFFSQLHTGVEERGSSLPFSSLCDAVLNLEEKLKGMRIKAEKETRKKRKEMTTMKSLESRCTNIYEFVKEATKSIVSWNELNAYVSGWKEDDFESCRHLEEILSEMLSREKEVLEGLKNVFEEGRTAKLNEEHKKMMTFVEYVKKLAQCQKLASPNEEEEEEDEGEEVEEEKAIEVKIKNQVYSIPPRTLKCFKKCVTLGKCIEKLGKRKNIILTQEADHVKTKIENLKLSVELTRLRTIVRLEESFGEKVKKQRERMNSALPEKKLFRRIASKISELKKLNEEVEGILGTVGRWKGQTGGGGQVSIKKVEEVFRREFQQVVALGVKSEQLESAIAELKTKGKNAVLLNDKEYDGMKEEVENTILVFEHKLELSKIKKEMKPIKKKIRDVDIGKRKLELELRMKTNENSDDEDESSGEEDDTSDEEDQVNPKEKNFEQAIIRLEKKKTELEKQLNPFRRRMEKKNRSIYITGHKTLPFMRNVLLQSKEKDEDEFVTFLKRTGLYVERKLSNDYETSETPVYENQGKVFIAKLISEFSNESKIVKVHLCSGREKIRVKNEITALVELRDHPSIIRYNNVFVEKNKICVEMDYYKTDFGRWLKGMVFDTGHQIKGEELRSLKTTRKKKTILRVLRKVLEGISFIHSKKIQHRDIKPANILLNNKYEVKIIDFGIARIRGGGNMNLTITRMNAGTARYCSPWNEPLFLKGAEEGYEKRDVYSFGLILLESLCKCEGSVVENIPKLLRDYFIQNTRSFHDALWKKLKIADRVDIEFLKRVLEPDFKKRLSAQQVLDYGYFGSPTQERKDAVLIVRKKHVENIKMKIDALRTRSTRGGRTRLNVTLDRRVDGEGKRKSIVVPFLEKVVGFKTSLRDLLSDLHVRFDGETGMDAGGVTRDALSLLFEQVCEEYCQEVGSKERAKFVMPSDQKDHSQVFYLLGVLCLRCFLENRSFKIPFPTYFYALLLNHQPRSYEDWEKFCLQCDPSFFSSLKESLYNPEMFKYLSGETFTTEGGRHEIALTESNKMEYMVFKIQNKLKGGTGGLNRLDKNFKHFKKGFYSLIEDDPLSLDIQHLLHPHELESIVFGDKFLPQEVLLANMVFKRGLVKRKEYLERYLSGTGEDDEKRRWDFLWFVTGSCDIMNKVLFKDCVPKKIEVVGTNDNSLRFKASTCFYKLYVGDKYERETFEKFSETVRSLIEIAKIEGNLEDL